MHTWIILKKNRLITSFWVSLCNNRASVVQFHNFPRVWARPNDTESHDLAWRYLICSSITLTFKLTYPGTRTLIHQTSFESFFRLSVDCHPFFLLVFVVFCVFVFFFRCIFKTAAQLRNNDETQQFCRKLKQTRHAHTPGWSCRARLSCEICPI